MGRKLGINKVKAGFSIDIDLYNDLNEFCDSEMRNKSRIVNNLIRKFLKENKRVSEVTSNIEKITE
jgi:metal-responsive CopG/Arc/MetJ family transcriptional regulator